MVENCCEASGCSLPGTLCPACQSCFCGLHFQSSTCEVCHTLLARRSFTYRFDRLASIGLMILLSGFLLLLLPRDVDGIIIQLALLLLIGGCLLLWLGLISHA